MEGKRTVAVGRVLRGQRAVVASMVLVVLRYILHYIIYQQPIFVTRGPTTDIRRIMIRGHGLALDQIGELARRTLHVQHIGL